jgi:hypothetical protein
VALLELVELSEVVESLEVLVPLEEPAEVEVDELLPLEEEEESSKYSGVVSCSAMKVS